MNNTTLDKMLVLVSMAALIGFCGFMVARVGVPDLLVCMGAVLALAFHDFWITVFRPKKVMAEMRDDLEKRPQGVSGKTVAGLDELLKK